MGTNERLKYSSTWWGGRGGGQSHTPGSELLYVMDRILCLFRLSGFEQGSKVQGLLLPGFACGWRWMSRLVENIWWVQSNGAATCGYGDRHSPGGLLELSKLTTWPPSLLLVGCRSYTSLHWQIQLSHGQPQDGKTLQPGWQRLGGNPQSRPYKCCDVGIMFSLLFA